jgi:hypothetical protein
LQSLRHHTLEAKVASITPPDSPTQEQQSRILGLRSRQNRVWPILLPHRGRKLTEPRQGTF